MRSTRLDLCTLSWGLVLALGCGDDDGGGASQAVAAKLQECKLATEGKVAPSVIETDLGECRARCDAAGTCEELTQLACEGQPSARTRDCYNDCLIPVDCADGRGNYNQLEKCNGRNDCADESDERGCPEPVTSPEFCEQSGARVLPFQRCNGIDECGDGTDEAGCPAKGPQFTCKTSAGGFSQQVPASQVCDLTPDCVDGSDESDEQGCARLACPN